MRWPFSEPTLRSDPAASPGVYATATLVSENLDENRPIFSDPVYPNGRSCTESYLRRDEAFADLLDDRLADD